jgi:hypothetical protein
MPKFSYELLFSFSRPKIALEVVIFILYILSEYEFSHFVCFPTRLHYSQEGKREMSLSLKLLTNGGSLWKEYVALEHNFHLRQQCHTQRERT